MCIRDRLTTVQRRDGRLASGLTAVIARPREYDYSRYVSLGAEVHHPDGLFDVEVVEDRTAAESGGSSDVTVDGSGRATMHPLLPYVTLQLSSIVNPRLFPVSHVRHCTHDNQSINQSLVY